MYTQNTYEFMTFFMKLYVYMYYWNVLHLKCVCCVYVDAQDAQYNKYKNNKFETHTFDN